MPRNTSTMFSHLPALSQSASAASAGGRGVRSHQLSPQPHGQLLSPGSAASAGCCGPQSRCAEAPEPRGAGAHPYCPSSFSLPAPVDTTAEHEPPHHASSYLAPLDQVWISPQLNSNPFGQVMLRLPPNKLPQETGSPPALLLIPSEGPKPAGSPERHRSGPAAAPFPVPAIPLQRPKPALSFLPLQPAAPRPSPPPCAVGEAAAPGAAGPPC